jgi:hypothetical protein
MKRTPDAWYINAVMKKETTGRQMGLPFYRTEQELAALLERGLGRKIALTLTSNSSSMLTAQVKGGVMRVRLHEMFLTAGPDILDEIAAFVGNKRRNLPLFRAFVRANSGSLQRGPARKVNVRTAGRHHDLLELFRELNREYFYGSVDAAITWGTSRTGVWVRKRTLGSYSATSNLIRINPVLDSARTPRYYVKFVVFHEMLHAHMGTVRKGGRRSIHPAEFRRREREFRDYDRAVSWEKR